MEDICLCNLKHASQGDYTLVSLFLNKKTLMPPPIIFQTDNTLKDKT